MSQFIIKQPDGRYAIFDNTIDEIVLKDGTAEEITRFEIREAITRAEAEAAAITPSRIKRADRTGSSGHPPFDIKWDEAVHIHNKSGGPALDNDNAWSGE